jgi:hypothetical protein
MNRRRTTAAIAFLAIAAAMLATAGAGWAAQREASVHGCLFKAVCVYNSKAHYRADDPAVTDTVKSGVYLFPATDDAVAVNNSLGTFSSEGNPELHVIHMTQFCLFVPDLSDVQSPGKTENPASGVVQGIHRGPTLESVEIDYPLPLSDCTGS